jgi:hypothetical protein
MAVGTSFAGLTQLHADKVESALRIVLEADADVSGWATRGVFRQPDPNVVPMAAPPYVIVSCVNLTTEFFMNRSVRQVGRYRIAAVYDERRVTIADGDPTAKSLLPLFYLSIMANATLKVAAYSNVNLIDDAPEFQDQDFGQVILNSQGVDLEEPAAPIIARFVSQTVQCQWELDRETWELA